VSVTDWIVPSVTVTLTGSPGATFTASAAGTVTIFAAAGAAWLVLWLFVSEFPELPEVDALVHALNPTVASNAKPKNALA
jgi:hypothetical protein